ncbi:MAG: cytochrome c peroxidase [Candidatus Promineifilaceae bacterium]
MRIKLKWLMFGAALLGVFALLAVAFGRPQEVRSAATSDPPDSATEAAFSEGGCAGCHTIPGIPNAVGQVGPDLSTIGSEASDRRAGLDAETYILESILDPAAFIAPECPFGACPQNVMLPNIAERLSEEQIDDIAGYLLTLTGEGVTSAPPYELIPIEIVRPAEADVIPFAEPPRTYDDALVLLGKYLFFDPRLSGDANVSCATCHQPDHAWSNPDALSPGYTGTAYFRNAPTIMNTVFYDYLYWDGRMDGADMPTLVRDHITEAHFMNSDGRLMVERVKQVPEYVQLFQDAYGVNPSFGRVLGAITAYVQSLNSGLSPYDLYEAGDQDALSPEAISGLELFEGKAGCAGCHAGPTFSDDEFYVHGVPENAEIWADPLRHITFRRFFRQLGVPNYRALDADPGLYALTKEDPDLGAFRTAPLREIARTAPYMHSGVFETLEEVIEFYNEKDDLSLTGGEVEQLVAFLESLGSDPVEVEPTDQPDYQLRTLGDNR